MKPWIVAAAFTAAVYASARTGRWLRERREGRAWAEQAAVRIRELEAARAGDFAAWEQEITSSRRHGGES